MRGVLDLEVAIQGSDRDLHSGVNGGLLPAPWPSFGTKALWVFFAIPRNEMFCFFAFGTLDLVAVTQLRC